MLNIVLPIGLSFHTFQSLSYVIEVYRGNQRAEKHFGIYSLYVMFYPQLVAGPIERPQNLLHQFREVHLFNSFRVTSGLKLMLWGFIKKLVIADRISLYVNEVFNNAGEYHGITVILAAFFFSFQIYCDFSGYSDIARGAARVMGFDLMLNFNLPYFATSVADFWRRWHISLSTWFKDYVYIPLGGSRVSRYKWYRNLILVFLISGFWHGANWTFIVWGALHGIFQIGGVITQRIQQTINKFLARLIGVTGINIIHICLTFTLVTMAWVFFRSNSIAEALAILKSMFIGIDIFHRGISIKQFGGVDAALSVIFIFAMELTEFLHSKYDLNNLLNKQPVALRWLVYYVAVSLLIFMGRFANQEFIYFQF